ncbi:MAG TPA: pyridoxamine 5'-phosphate oxidase family protein, partial [Methylomirabilota bacterium]|nr:pyridoxamine 5'-phosphate oxidase family protein [Methylomirabilota bacterium]
MSASTSGLASIIRPPFRAAPRPSRGQCSAAGALRRHRPGDGCRGGGRARTIQARRATTLDAAELDRHRYVSLATFRRHGAVVLTPVWFAAADGKLYVVTGGASGKVKRLRHTPRV